MSPSAPTSPLRRLLEGRLSELSVELEKLFAETRERSRRDFADQLNQSVRRIRQAGELVELCATLADAAGSFATGAAIFRIDGEIAKGERLRGVPEEQTEAFGLLEIPLKSAAALAAAVESRDPVIAIASEAEVSAELVKLAGHGAESRASIFPLVVREKVAALLYVWGDVQGAAVELLSQVAAGVWSELAKPAVPAADLVLIAPAAPTPAPAPVAAPVRAASPRASWDELPAEEQQVHFRAQRFARVQVAELRLYEPEAVQSGRTRRNLYEALRKPIDTARDTFRKTFFAPCPSMVDYLHLELVRTLANDDPELLGNDYPGPLA